MSTNLLYRKLASAALAALIALAGAGCNTYESKVEIKANGSGTRTLELTVSPDTDSGVTMDVGEIRLLYALTDERKWEKIEDSDRQDLGNKFLFRCTGKADKPAEWSRMSGDITLRGSAESGPVRKVNLTNTITLQSGSYDGEKTYTYREILVWSGIRKVLSEFFAQRFTDELEAAYGEIERETLAELRGLFKGHFDMIFPELANDEFGDEITERLTSSIQESAFDIIKEAGIDDDRTGIDSIAVNVIRDEDNLLDRYLDKNLPGVSMAFSTELRLSVTMPGKIIDSNGQISEDGRTASWEVGLLDPIAVPYEMYVKSGVDE